MRNTIRRILREELLNESGIRNINNLAERYKKAKIYFHQDLDGVTTALAMKHYLEKNRIKVVDAEIIQYGSKEFAVKKPEASGEVMPVLVDFAHGKLMFEIHTDHHDRQTGVEAGTATSFKHSRSNVETISQILSPQEIFTAEDILLISIVDSANFAKYDLSIDDVLSYLFKLDRDSSLARNKMLMGLVTNKLLLAFKNKPGFLEELVLECKPSLLNILLKIKSIMKREGFDSEEKLTQNQQQYIQSMNISPNVNVSGNILVQYGGGYMTPQGSYDRYTPFKNNPEADFLVIAWPMGLVQASRNPYKKDKVLQGIHLGDIKNEVLNEMSQELKNIRVTFGDIKRISESDAKEGSVGFTLKDLMAIYGDLPSFKVEGGDRLLEILDSVSNTLYRKLSDKQKVLFEKITLNGLDTINANSGGHPDITNISGINFLYRNKKDPRLDNVPEDLIPIATYSGMDPFLNDIKDKLLKWGRLSDKQIEVAMSKLNKTKSIDSSETESTKKGYVDLTKRIQSKFVEKLKSYTGQD